MFGDKTLIAVSAAALEIVVQIVKFYGNSQLVARFGDAAHIVGISVGLVVGEESEGVDNVRINPEAQQITESIVGVLDDIVKKSGALLFGCLACSSNRPPDSLATSTIPTPSSTWKM